MKKINLNTIAKEITKAEGKKHPVNIGDVKEIQKIIFTKYSFIDLFRIKWAYIRKEMK